MSVVKSLFLLPVILLAAASCNSGGFSGNTSASTYQEKVMSVEETERANPSQFLVADGTYRPNFWGDKMKISGTVENTATVANFKDVVIEVTFYSATQTVLDTRQYTLYEYVPAHSKKTFEWRVDAPQDCKKLGWRAVSGTPY